MGTRKKLDNDQGGPGNATKLGGCLQDGPAVRRDAPKGLSMPRARKRDPLNLLMG